MTRADPRIAITLLGGFECTVSNDQVALGTGAGRMLAFLAVSSTPVHRGQLARSLWPGRTPSRAAANLRSALWQVRRSPASAALTAVEPRLGIADGVNVDLRQIPDRAADALDNPAGHPAFDELLRRLRSDLLTGWDDEWLDLERERWHNTRIHVLEHLAEECVLRGSYRAAYDAALEAVTLEPFRETAHRLVVRISLAEGNPAAALHHYYRYRDMLQLELEVAPSSLLEELIRPVLRPDPRVVTGSGDDTNSVRRLRIRRCAGQ